MKSRALISLVAAMVFGFLACGAALAQGFPNRPVTIVVPFAAGSPTDAAARAFAVDFGEALNAAIVIDNRPGAAQSIAGAAVAHARADGYTLLFANLPAVVPPSIQAGLPYVGIRDFAPISDIMTIRYVLAASPNVPASNLREFVALLKADPAKYSFGSSGLASPTQLVAEMFNNRIGVKPLHVPYKGANQIQLDLISDRVTYGFLPTGAMEFVRTGKLKSFGVASDIRDATYPELPTMSEAGLPGFTASIRFVLVAPKQTPADVVAKLNAAANKVIANEAFYPKVKAIGGVQISRPATPAQVGATISNDEAHWADVVKKAGIVLE